MNIGKKRLYHSIVKNGSCKVSGNAQDALTYDPLGDGSLSWNIDFWSSGSVNLAITTSLSLVVAVLVVLVIVVIIQVAFWVWGYYHKIMYYNMGRPFLPQGVTGPLSATRVQTGTTSSTSVPEPGGYWDGVIGDTVVITKTQTNGKIISVFCL